jgi:hypothetical protein
MTDYEEREKEIGGAVRHNIFIRRHKHKITAQKVPRLRRLVYRVDIRITKGIMLKSKEDKGIDSKMLIAR